jgi:hypothetical protein
MSPGSLTKKAPWRATLATAALLLGCQQGNVPGRLGAQSTGDLSNPAAERGRALAVSAEGCGAQQDPRAASGDELGEVLLSEPAGNVVARVPARREDTVRTPRGVAQLFARLEGLRPSTLYCYEVRQGGVTLARAALQTAPAPGGAQPVRFVVFGDSGGGSSDQLAVRDQLGTVPFDFMLHTGDVAYNHGTRGELGARFFDVYAGLLERAPAFPSSGNHDYESEDAAPFREAFHLPDNGGPEGRERWYSFDWGDVHFVALDTERIGPGQAAWLDQDLARNTRPWVVVYGHKPPYSSGTHGGDEDFQRVFLPILERHRVPLVLSGHDHDYERTRTLGGVTYVVTGGGGNGTGDVARSSFTAFAEPVQHFVYVTVAGDTLALHAIDGLGREFDSLVLRR